MRPCGGFRGQLLVRGSGNVELGLVHFRLLMRTASSRRRGVGRLFHTVYSGSDEVGMLQSRQARARSVSISSWVGWRCREVCSSVIIIQRFEGEWNSRLADVRQQSRLVIRRISPCRFAATLISEIRSYLVSGLEGCTPIHQWA